MTIIAFVLYTFPEALVKMLYILSTFRVDAMTDNFDADERLLRDPQVRVKRNVVINGARTTVNLEQLFWEAVDQLASEEGVTVDEICAQIARANKGGGGENLASAIRVVCMMACQMQAQHDRAAAGDKTELRSPQAVFPSRFHHALSRISGWDPRKRDGNSNGNGNANSKPKPKPKPKS